MQRLFSFSARRSCCCAAGALGQFPHPSFPSRGVSSVSSSVGNGDIFSFFGESVGPVLDTEKLQKTYHALQMKVHPDKQQTVADGTTTASPPIDAAVAEKVSKYANEAYRILKRPYLRCKYLAKMKRAEERKGGVALTVAEMEALLDETESRQSLAQQGNVELSESFLMEVMAMNELIFTGNLGDEMIRNQLKILQKDLQDRDLGYFQEATEYWKDGQWLRFQMCVNEWTYIANALQHLQDRLL